MPASLTCPFDAKDLPLARAAAEEAGLQYEEITDLAVASQAYIKTGYEKGARFPEVYGSTAQQYIEKGGAVVRLTRTDEDHNFSKFWEILNAARGTK